MPMHAQEIREKTKYLDDKVTELFEDDYIASMQSLGSLLRSTYMKSLEKLDKRKDLENYLKYKETCNRLFMEEISGCWLLFNSYNKERIMEIFTNTQISIDSNPIKIEFVVEDKKSEDKDAL